MDRENQNIKKKPRGRNEKGTRFRGWFKSEKMEKKSHLANKKRQCFRTDGCVSLHYFCKKWYLVSMHTNHVIKKTHAHGANITLRNIRIEKKNASFIADRVLDVYVWLILRNVTFSTPAPRGSTKREKERESSAIIFVLLLFL